jgi:hypothetical protein
MGIREFRGLREFDNPGGPTGEPPFSGTVIFPETGAIGKFAGIPQGPSGKNVSLLLTFRLAAKPK